MGTDPSWGSDLQALLSYPDQPFREETVTDKATGEVIASAPALPQDWIYPKERRLIDLVRDELSQGRKVLLYVTHTERRDITGRLERLLAAEGFSVSVLKSHTVPSERREGWIAEKLKNGLQVLITQPRNVQTGLDLIDFPTIVFYEPEYSVYTLRQAGRRSWRIGQRRPVKVYFMAYRETLQERGLRLIAAKIRSALAVEGELVDEGLSAFQEGQDLFLQLARSIVEPESVPAGDFEGGIARASGQEPDRYLLPEGANFEGAEQDKVSNGNEACIPEGRTKAVLSLEVIAGDNAASNRTTTFPASEKASPPFESIGSPQQLVLF